MQAVNCALCRQGISLPPEGESMSDNPVLDMLARIDGRLGRLEERQSALEKGQAALEKGQAALEKGQTSLRVDLMARMDRISDQITLIKDDQTVTMGASDSV